MIDIRRPLSCDEIMARLTTMFSNNNDRTGVFLQSTYDLVKNIYEKQPDFVSTRYKVKTSGEEAPLTMPFLQYRLNMAGIMAENMNANATIILSALLGPAIKLKWLYRSSIKTQSGVRAYECVAPNLQPVSNVGNDVVKKCDEIDLLLFNQAIEDDFDNLCKKMRKKNHPQIAYVKQAYKVAAAAHNGTYRQSGEPYIIHPLMVADILAYVGAESEIIAAALLHDVLEDTDVSQSTIEGISPQIARYVQAVTSVEKDYEEYKRRKEALGETYDEQEKEDLDRETVNKLIKCATEDESMIFAFYIKAADRLHNLRTIDGMPVDKMRDKLNETKEFYLPIFRKFGLHDFADAIDDQIWRVSNIGNSLYTEVSDAYDHILNMNSENMKKTQRLLENVTEDGIQKCCDEFSVQSFSAVVTKQNYYPYQVFKKVQHIPASKKAKSISKKNTPMCYFDVVVDADNLNDLMLYAKLFVKAFNMSVQDECLELDDKCVITGFAIEPVNIRQPEKKRFKLVIEDAYYTKYDIYIYNQENYCIYCNGSEKGINIPVTEKTAADEFDKIDGTIKVYCPDNAPMELPKGATALDFAFRVHREIGMYALKAGINGSTPSEKQLYAILTDGDKVEIEYDSEQRDGYGGKSCVGAHVKIEWLNHVKTDKARKAITQWLHNKYEANANM